MLHLVHPQPVPWSTIIASFASELGLPRAPYAVWLAALEAAHAELYSGSELSTKVIAEAHATNPALRLRPFLARRAHEGGECGAAGDHAAAL